MYNIEIRICSKNGWFTPDEARRYYGRYSREGITWHWWGDGTGASNHDNIVRYIASGAAAGQKSVNYVLSDNKITLMVGPDNVAWTSQSGNPVSISVELQPTLNAEGYKKAGWLAWQLKERYGHEMTYWKHNQWFSTQCPGSISLDRIKQEQIKWQSGAYNPAPIPTPDPTPTPIPPVTNVPVTFTQIAAGTYVCNKQPTNLYQVNKSTWGGIGVIKGFNKNDRIDIYGVVKNSTLGGEWYVTKYSFDNKLPNGFSKSDLDPYIAPIPEPPVPIEPQVTVIPPITMFTITDGKLLNIKDLGVVKIFALDTPMEIMGKSIFNGKEFYLTRYAVEHNTKQGFLVGDLKPSPTPIPEPEPELPEWEENLQDLDIKEQKLIDITTGNPAIVNGKETIFEEDDEFVSSAMTRVGNIEYRITEYSLQKMIFNGVPTDSLSLTPPGEPDEPPIEPSDPIDKNTIILFLEAIVTMIRDFINSLKKK